MNYTPRILTPNAIVYARSGGSCYHIDKQCPFLKNAQYNTITYEIALFRHLNPCLCATEGYKHT